LKLGMIGLGRMGGNIARRLHRAGHQCVVYDRDPKAVSALASDTTGAGDLADLVKKLEAPRAVWVMLPAGQITDDTVTQLAAAMETGDTIIDGGNSYYRDDVRRAATLRNKGIHYLDVGTSGGVWGLERGYCMMIGGDKEAVDRLDPIFAALAPGKGEIPETPGREGRDRRVEQGYIHCGAAGSGHFVKMIHNGIEYGLMQAYGEGFSLLAAAAGKDVPEAERYDLDLGDIAEVWRRGSVIPSWLLDLCATALAADEKLADYAGDVEDSGEGRWTVQSAVERAVPAPVLTEALFARFASRGQGAFSNKLLSAMRHGFGGHVEPGKKRG
jgi:6-phosphogluconate dehydrogenase